MVIQGEPIEFSSIEFPTFRYDLGKSSTNVIRLTVALPA